MTDRSVSITVRFHDTEALKEQGAPTRPLAAEIHLTPEEFRSFFLDGALMALDDSPAADDFLAAGEADRLQSLHSWTNGLWESVTQIIRSLSTQEA